MLSVRLGRDRKTNQHLHKSVALLQMLRRKYFFKSTAGKQKVHPRRVEKTRKKPWGELWRREVYHGDKGEKHLGKNSDGRDKPLSPGRWLPGRGPRVRGTWVCQRAATRREAERPPRRCLMHPAGKPGIPPSSRGESRQHLREIITFNLNMTEKTAPPQRRRNWNKSWSGNRLRPCSH